jgi:hypothetical protein
LLFTVNRRGNKQLYFKELVGEKLNTNIDTS